VLAPGSPPTPARPDAQRRARSPAVQRTLVVILALNALVVGVKLYVGIRSGALSVLGAALESALDLMNNLIGIVLVSVAARAPDEDHPYGHEKFETLGALAIVGFLSISCFELLREGISHALSGRAPRRASALDLGLLVATGAVNIFVVWYERLRGRALASPFLLADAEHTRSDIFVTALALASLALTRVGLGRLDPLLAIVVALLIAWSGYRILRDTVPILVDERAVDADEIRRIALAVPGVSEVRSVRSRRTATELLFAEVTVGVRANSTVAAAHDVADAVEARIGDVLGASEVTVHVEPA
jgi:cation diffusion facilitator family transporter